MERFPRLRSRTVIFTHDLIMVALAWIGAYWLRFNLSVIPASYLRSALSWLPVVLVLQGGLFRLFGLYRGVWRFASLPDLVLIGKSVSLGALAAGVTAFLYNRLEGVPRSVLPLYAVLLLMLLCGPRIAYRMYKDRGRLSGSGKRALVVGAGCAGEMLVRDLRRERNAEFLPVAFVDDDARKKGREIHGLRVRGGCERIPQLVRSLEIETVLIATPSADEKHMRRIVEICETAEAPFLTLPSVHELLAGGLPHSLRDVSIEDLLGRAPVSLDHRAVADRLRGRRVLVTGGGGSIGSQLCREIARFPVSELIVFERCEFNLYQIEGDLRRLNPDLAFVPLLGDVTDRAVVEHTLAQYRPDVIFHAAAYKHVPLLQQQARAAVLNNVAGTRTVAEAAVAVGVGSFVLISTDKAVNPTNVMGATKRAAEMVVQSLVGAGATRFVTVRFGNVLDSAGSVVPLFRAQIRAGGPLTVTHPDITRYFMTIPEACQLILQAGAVGRGGEVFVLDMGEPVKVSYLAEQMIRLSGKRPGVDIRIEYIGLRPGEKLYEELFHDEEPLTPTGIAKLLLAQARPLKPWEFRPVLEQLESGCATFDEALIESRLRALVPEFRPSDDVAEAGEGGALAPVLIARA
ncbi:nucleoside-diphosphate sugar epimerase/dehydratase [Methylococcus sp. EFPC2]|uniref:polysaccharide biosynthesis protein n=1 Tax=Methylococcus sp. EFPC2 TaxID=2812648 RepID=UPI001967412F|nr:nucleoside-diphosphate sugar epimerase/dehydratase [Methylococcus sp. EFPC2]QSA95825.1 polysaccharide biosynthesis protein [Methylococcus sp. EFPC2]